MKQLWGPTAYTKEEHRAIHALMRVYRGEKEVDEQTDAVLTHYDAKLFVDWLLYKACLLREDAFFATDKPTDPEGSREYVMGKQSVARNMMKLDSLKIEVDKK